MNSRYSATGLEAEFEKASRGRVLRNKLGIHRVREMQATESAALEKAQERLLERFSGDHRFTAADICGIHHDWLGDIYEWAGAYRGVNVSKGGLMFAAAGLVPGLMAGFERARDRANVHAMIVTGANGVFTGGADIKEFGAASGT